MNYCNCPDCRTDNCPNATPPFAVWQRIESAPKDRRILLCLGGQDWVIGSWNQKAFDGPRWEDDGLEAVPFIIAPTHWMPLPNPPALEVSESNVMRPQSSEWPGKDWRP